VAYILVMNHKRQEISRLVERDSATWTWLRFDVTFGLRQYNAALKASNFIPNYTFCW
jgi:hypothetical protein